MKSNMRELSTTELNQIAGGGWGNDGTPQTPISIGVGKDGSPFFGGMGNDGSPFFGGMGNDGSPFGGVGNCGIFNASDLLLPIIIPIFMPGKP